MRALDAVQKRGGLLALLLLVGLVGCSEDPEPTTEPVRPPDPERQAVAGEALYERYCALCHGQDGEGYAADNAPSLRSPEWLRSASDEFLVSAISNGRPGTPMSAWSRRHGGPLRDAQIEALRVFIRSRQEQPQASVDQIEVEADADAGRVIYTAQCARCHGRRGEGIDAVALANPQFLEDASDGFIQYAVLHGRTGTPMESFANRLTPNQVNEVVTYVRSFEDGAAAPPSAANSGEPELPNINEMPLVIHPDGDAPEFDLRANRFVSAEQVKDAFERGDRMVILDARATSDWLRGRIPGAIPVPFYELSDIIQGLPRDGTPMIAYCGCPHAASGRVVDALRAEGFTNTAVLDEGIHFWEEHEFPMADGSELP
ncbi:MAG: c-type cytochrome [Sandaracinaceae bacterium]